VNPTFELFLDPDPREAMLSREFHEIIASSDLLELHTPNGTRLAGRSWEVPSRVKEVGAVLIVHGFGEHNCRYPHVARAFTEAGLRVVAFDLRGHGQSSGRRGHITHYREYLEDLDCIASHLRLNKGWLLFGHSLGAQILWHWLARNTYAVSGAILASPWFRLSKMPSRAKILLAHALAGIAPGMRQNTGGGNAHLSSDPSFLYALPGKPLSHRVMSTQMYLECSNAGRIAGQSAAAIQTPIWMPHGGSDWLTCADATLEIAASFTQVHQKAEILPNARHELHNDAGREEYLRRATGWMLDRL